MGKKGDDSIGKKLTCEEKEKQKLEDTSRIEPLESKSVKEADLPHNRWPNGQNLLLNPI
ncbi:hypothetical protein ACLOJK_004087 [Asimina triloba]